MEPTRDEATDQRGTEDVADEGISPDSPVIVGVDASQGSRVALAWAVNKQATFGDVTPLMTYHLEPFGDGLGLATSYGEVARVVKEDSQQQLIEMLTNHPDEVKARARLVRGYAGPALVRAAADADLLVIGSRGRSALAETLFGSVGSYCTKHATVPVAVIPESAKVAGDVNRIVVGVDGSRNAEGALRWAVDHVPATGSVLALACWTPPTSPDGTMVGGAALQASTRSMVEASVERALAGNEGSPVVNVGLECGDSRYLLREVGAEADLLVVGARGHRGIPHLLLGSVTTSLLHHPLGPTVVVPDSVES